MEGFLKDTRRNSNMRVAFHRTDSVVVMSILRRVVTENTVTFETIARFNLDAVELMHAMNLDKPVELL